jgi:protein-export membrane protein SecD
MRNLKYKFTFILLCAILMGVIALPQNIKSNLPDSIFLNWLKIPAIQLGLDLQGGVQLDYKIDLTKAIQEEADINKLVEGTLNIIERRVNALGVSEPRIQVSNIGDETHIIVELAGIHDTEKAKELIGKPVTIEFKEEQIEPDPAQLNEMKTRATGVLEKAKTTGADFKAIGEEEQTLNAGKAFFSEISKFQDELGEKEQKLWELEANTVLDELVEEELNIPNQNQTFSLTTLSLYKVIDKVKTTREIVEPGEDFITVAKEISALPEEADLSLISPNTLPENIESAIRSLAPGSISEIIETENYFEIYKLEKEILPNEDIQASHILISYAGAERAKEGLTRTKEEAQQLAQEVLTKAKDQNQDFGDLAAEYSEDPSAATNRGDLGFFGRGVMAPEFETTAFALQIGELSNVVETPFGFHIIKKTNEQKEYQVDLQKIAIDKNQENAEQLAKDTVARLQEKTISRTEDQLNYQLITYSLFPDPWKETGLGSEQFEGAKIAMNDANRPYLIINFDDQGTALFDEITARNLQKRVAIFVGGELVSAPTVQERISSGSAQISSTEWTYPAVAELKMLLDAGNFPAPLIIKGETKIGATLGEESLQKSITAGLFGLLLLSLYMLIYYRLMGFLADIALLIYAVIILFILNISSVLGAPIIMTLAGVAGFILSIGMAVDANVLIFERIKEELNTGKNLSASIKIGFERAWSSIRDSNLSTLLTCAVLAWFGTSIIRGFAITLGIGVLVSMFSAIIITKTFLQMTVGGKISKIAWLYGVKRIKN